MKNYNQWMTNSNNSEDLVYEMAEKSLIKINGSSSDFETILNDANEWQKDVDLIWLINKSIFSPSMGDYIEYNSLFYLNVYMSEERETYWSSKARLCNSTFPIVINKRTVLLGTDKLGRPVTEQVSDIKQEPCIVETRYYFNNRNEQVTLPEDRIMVTLKYQESESVAINQIFDMYNSQFKITFVDYTKTVNGKGTMTITGERMVKK